MVQAAPDGSGFDAVRDSHQLEGASQTGRALTTCDVAHTPTLLAGETKERYDAFLSLWERVELEDLTGAELTRSVHCCDQSDRA